MQRISSVKTDKNHFLIVSLDNGQVLQIDMSKRLGMIRFAPLADTSLFDSATTDGCFVKWCDKVEISIRELME